MKIILSSDDVKEAISSYLRKTMESKKITEFKMKLKRKNSSTEELGSIVLEFEDEK